MHHTKEEVPLSDLLWMLLDSGARNCTLQSHDHHETFTEAFTCQRSEFFHHSDPFGVLVHPRCFASLRFQASRCSTPMSGTAFRRPWLKRIARPWTAPWRTMPTRRLLRRVPPVRGAAVLSTSRPFCISFGATSKASSRSRCNEKKPH